MVEYYHLKSEVYTQDDQTMQNFNLVGWNTNSEPELTLKTASSPFEHCLFPSMPWSSGDLGRRKVYHHLQNGVQAYLVNLISANVRSRNCYFISQNHIAITFFSFLENNLLDYKLKRLLDLILLIILITTTYLAFSSASTVW